MDLGSELRPAGSVRLSGDLDVFRKHEITASFPDPAKVGSITINLLRARYMDSTVLGMLVGLRRDFIAGSGDPQKFKLQIVRNSIVHRAFDLAGILKLFNVEFSDETVRINVRGRTGGNAASTP